MTPDERQAAINRVRQYADEIRAHERDADAQSLERARDLAVLYEDKSWVSELEPPKNKVYRGRRVDPESRNRFAKWLLTRQEIGLHASYTYRLLTAEDLATSFALGRNKWSGEKAIRPLKGLEKRGLADRATDVVHRALELAHEEGKSKVESTHTKQAVAELIASIPKREVRQSENRHRAEVKVNKIKMEFQQLLALGRGDLVKDLLIWEVEEAERFEKQLEPNENTEPVAA